MKVFKNSISVVMAALLVIAANSASAANDALVQLDPTASGNYSVVGINEFDWQSSGDLVIEDELPSAAIADGVPYTSLSLWLINAVAGDTVSFNAHAQARMNDILSTGGSSIRPNTLSRDGSTCDAGADCWESTVIIDATFGATLVSAGKLDFNTAFGNYAFMLDTSPDTNVSTGAGFNDGIAFLAGDFISLGGSFTVGVGGGNFTRASVETQNTDVIEMDPDDGSQILSGVTYDTLVSLVSSLEDAVGTGGVVGILPYTVQDGDFIFKADANSEFFSEDVELLGSCRMTGGGVDETGVVLEGTLAAAASEDGDRYQFGGQVGAPSATQPQPFGEWTHHQQKGPSGRFVFHAGTHSAPAGTAINLVECSDEGFCHPARPAFFKQIDYEGVGTFKNASGAIGKLVTTERKPNPSLHFFEVHVEDIGEPGPGGKQPKSGECTHVPRTPIDEAEDCSNCPDIYQIRIHATTDPDSPVIYNAGWPDGGFIDGGNLQLHPEVGQQPPK